MPARQPREARYRYIVFFKPYDVVCQFSDAEGRRTLKEYVAIPGIYPVGRLDRDSEGLLILTDDGTYWRIALPIRGLNIPKTYLVQVERIPDLTALESLRRGVNLKDGLTRPAQADLLDEPPALAERTSPIRFRKNVPTAWLRLSIREGRNRQVRRMTASVGHPTLRLVRMAIGPITLARIWPSAGGATLNTQELAFLGRVREEPPRRHTQPDPRGRRRDER